MLTLGEKIIDIFIEQGFLTDFVSIYHLREYTPSILSLEGFKDKKLENILESIEASRNMPLANFFVALGIPQVGRKTGKLLAKYVSEKMIENKEEIKEKKSEDSGSESGMTDDINSHIL